jgi:hypothetical protein
VDVAAKSGPPFILKPTTKGGVQLAHDWVIGKFGVIKERVEVARGYTASAWMSKDMYNSYVRDAQECVPEGYILTFIAWGKLITRCNFTTVRRKVPGQLKAEKMVLCVPLADGFNDLRNLGEAVEFLLRRRQEKTRAKEAESDAFVADVFKDLADVFTNRENAVKTAAQYSRIISEDAIKRLAKEREKNARLEQSNAQLSLELRAKRAAPPLRTARAQLGTIQHVAAVGDYTTAITAMTQRMSNMAPRP